MTKVTNFFKNPFDNSINEVKDASKVEQLSRTQNKAGSLFKDKPFAAENKTKYTISLIIKYTANIISFTTAFFALQILLSLIVGQMVGIGAAFLICALIELLKNASWETSVKQYLRYNKISVLGGLSLLGLSSISIAASLYGAYLIPTELKRPEAALYSKNDSLVLNEMEVVNSQIANLDKMYLETSAKAIPNKQGKVSSTFKVMLASLTAQKDSLSSQKRALNAQIAKISSTGNIDEIEANKAFNEHIFYVQKSCVLVALMFELLYTLCSIYCFYYLFRVYVDSPPTAQQKVFDATKIEPLQSNPIGFFHGLQTSETNGIENRLQTNENGVIGNDNGIKFVWHNGEKYHIQGVKSNLAANKHKANLYENNGKIELASKYKNAQNRWENYLINLNK